MKKNFYDYPFLFTVIDSGYKLDITGDKKIDSLLKYGWIPRNERLPPENEKILVLFADEVILMGIMDSNKEFSIFWRNGIGREYNETPITHWMPLPNSL